MHSRNFEKFVNRPRGKNTAGDEMPMNPFRINDIEFLGTTSSRRILHHLSVSAIVWRKDWRLRNLEGSDIYQDCLQEVEIALLEEPVDFAAIGKAVHRCLRQYGYYKTSGVRNKHGKESRFRVDKNGNEIEPTNVICICGYGSVYPELCECGMNEKSFSLAKKILSYYETHSAEETCAHFGVKRTRKIEKALMSAMPKQAGTGKGGKRENAGRKKELIWNAETF